MIRPPSVTDMLSMRRRAPLKNTVSDLNIDVLTINRTELTKVLVRGR